MDFLSYIPFTFELTALLALINVVLIDLVLAGDNAIVIGMAAAAVERSKRTAVVFWGMAAACAMRIGFTAVTAQLLTVTGLTFIGGLLLTWVCWKFWRQLRSGEEEEMSISAKTGMLAAISTIIIADISMSLDNVLAVAGAAGEHFSIMVFGLLLSVGLMGTAANAIAAMLHRWPQIAYAGLAVIVYVAGDMLYRGGVELNTHFNILNRAMNVASLAR